MVNCGWKNVLAGVLFAAGWLSAAKCEYAPQLAPGILARVQAAAEPADMRSKNFVTAEPAGDELLLKSGEVIVSLNRRNLTVTVRRTGQIWRLAELTPSVVRFNGEDHQLELKSAGRRRIEPEQFAGVLGYKIYLAGWKAAGVELDLAMVLFVGLEWETGDVIFELRPQETGAVWRQCRWPGALEAGDADGTAVPFMQGLYIPRRWPQAFETPYGDGPGYGMAYGRTLYMPWWGISRGGQSAMLILETPDDAGCTLKHSPESGTGVEVLWLHSLGKMGYVRRARLSTLDGNYVQMAKRYRQYAREHGKFVGLNEKIARTPVLEKLLGSPILHTTVMYTNMRAGRDRPEGDTWWIDYRKHADNIRRLKEAGLERLYVHFDGIGYRGYDNLEPDQLPVGRQPGGVEGLKQLLAECRRLDVVTAFHQQYRDFYTDAPSYDPELLVRKEDGSRPMDDIWAGGKNGILCQHRSLDYVRRNNQFLAMLGVRVDGCYLDVFAAVPADECYHPEHPMSRTQCYRARGECFRFIKEQWGIVSSEEPVDWAIPYLDLAHHGPWPVMENDTPFAIMIPLFNLVYHDAIFLPFESKMTRDSYYYPATEIPGLYGLLNAGMPYVAEEPTPEELETVKAMAALHRRVGLLEMTGHELLDDAGRRQRSTFADGTTVTIDQENGTYRIVIPPEN